mgnify:CR=1 FL=1
MARKAKTEKSSKKKSKKKSASSGLTTHQRMAKFYASRSGAIEKDLQLVANALHDPDRISTGVLQIDWMLGSGLNPGLTLFSGEEQSGKTTAVYHALASSVADLHLPYNVLYDAEGSVSKNYTGNIWAPFGLDIEELLSKAGKERGFYYFRNNVIEKMFDFVKKSLKNVPDKHWNAEAGSWAYYFPKRDEEAKAMMQAMEAKPDQQLSKGAFYVVPTDYAGCEGIFCPDSFASLLTKASEEKENSGSERSAMEASEFSGQLKRIKVDLFDKKIAMLGTNQLRSHVRAVYGGPDAQLYESGGNALRFYSDARARFFSRSTSAAKKFGSGFDYDKDASQFGIEQSVESNGTDRYAYKEVKNTKNKFGKPGLKTLIRVWVSDANGHPRGIDPAFDVFIHLYNTYQIRKTGKNKTPYAFNLDISSGKEFSARMNAAEPFSFLTLKKLVIGEYIGDNSIIKDAVNELGLNFKPRLRERLFLQLKKDDGSLYSNIRKSANVKAEDMEDDESEDYEEL